MSRSRQVLVELIKDDLEKRISDLGAEIGVSISISGHKDASDMVDVLWRSIGLMSAVSCLESERVLALTVAKIELLAAAIKKGVV
jgi:hypothetical protein